MARKNRKNAGGEAGIVRKTASLCILSILGLSVIAVFYAMSQAACTDASNRRRTLEREIRRLEDDCLRENGRWQSMCASVRLDKALRENGMAMRQPNHAQIIHMNASLKPRAGQIAVAKMNERAPANAVAANSQSALRRRR